MFQIAHSIDTVDLNQLFWGGGGRGGIGENFKPNNRLDKALDKNQKSIGY